ncbi:DGQHR domain-containing protein [Luteibacter sp. UNC138MFCol5.1]|uniref:DGQHR domain-containing protein n=1 Tax=Luteibacter sp. UNC138MFCol5.1 TaxID=1502774 RepID=UPI000B7CB79C|nr:DGQHR domain-containing protein [Luteibacter sp. UNC138MFCol5.1]
MKRPTYPFVTTALRVDQPLGIFYIVSLPAAVVLDVAYSDRLSARYSSKKNEYTITGTQRAAQMPRLEAIAKYVSRVDAAFPNAIILAGNAPQLPEGADTVANASDDAEDLDDGDEWSIVEGPAGQFQLTIPSDRKMANIIDGQHRLFGLARAPVDAVDHMGLVCAIFLDLPQPFQAQLFAIINSTQKPVDKSLTYEQFGYNVLDEEPEMWTPDKLAVFLSRRLAVEKDSPLFKRIIIAPKKDKALEALTNEKLWRVSTATVVQGISRLYSSNPGRDATQMLAGKRKPRSSLERFRKDNSPLRPAFIEGNDLLIYTIAFNFLSACKEEFWKKQPDSFITRTVGVQALFDVLRLLIPEALAEGTIATSWFRDRLRPAGDIDFNEDRFNASGSGRSLISREIRAKLNLTTGSKR